MKNSYMWYLAVLILYSLLYLECV